MANNDALKRLYPILNCVGVSLIGKKVSKRYNSPKYATMNSIINTLTQVNHCEQAVFGVNVCIRVKIFSEIRAT